MYSDGDLEAAVAAGALTPEAAASLRDYVAGRAASPAVDEEHFRLITGFNDIFVAVAAAILFFALGWIGSTIGPRIEVDGPSPIGALLVAGAAWGLAEFFTRKRRMALPSILMLLAFVGAVGVATGLTLVLAVGAHNVDGNNQVGGGIAAVAAAVAAGAAWLHWRR